MNGSEAPLRRLNGRLQACDQCRARKVACDHARPTCSRCLKRKQASECSYTVGSVLQPRRRVRRQEMRAPNPPTPNHAKGSADPNANQNQNQNQNANANASAAAAAGAGASANGSPRPGYMGFASHTIVFEETKRSLSLLQGPGADPRLPRPCADDRMTPKRYSFGELPHIVRHMSIHVLTALSGQRNEQVVLHDGNGQKKTLAQVALARITRSVEDLLKKGPDGTGPDLEPIAEMICNNSAQPLRDVDDPQQWMDQFSGKNLRWESIGLIGGHLERLANTINSFWPYHVGWIPGEGSDDPSRTYVNYCIDLARHFSEGNPVLLDLHRRRTILVSLLDGDAASSCWYSHSAAVSMVTFMGLHALEKEIPYTPTLCSENNRRLVAQIFTTDKNCVAFSGRPPLLSRRYCSTPLPLDIGDEDLVADEATLQKAVQELDERGWNTRGAIYPATLIRARRMFAAILEEVMEVASGYRVSLTLDEIRNIQDRQTETLAGFPACLKYDPQDLSDPDVDVETVYARILIRLTHLQNMFLLERLLLLNGSSNRGNILLFSFEMLTLTLTLWTHKDRFAAMRRSFEWLLMAHAAPAGGILCLELLNPTLTGKHPGDPQITRSSIIQSLSLLIGFLDWVRPSAPNGDLCMDCKIIIQRVLDHTLNGSVESGSPWAALAYDFPEPLDFNFGLLDTFDWLHTDVQ
ncbi:hypothetical protein Trco_006220 [Trichoderma cornu-damae]|uniref:Zn(2)-C6 fungal-type domain-containing protein n=1 Tax=Trichoderma cornu-damae TaxID=654480 RepID=A0A9P8QKQ9_9HYPO|nr:hypothetical protein Trco_006220 [Trichoderma cornu-damae]